MPRYRVYYLREDLSRRFRELPAASVRKQLKQREYEQVGEIEAANAYAAWSALQTGGSPECPLSVARAFTVGDALEQDQGKLELCLFGGFEEVSWWTPPEPSAPAPADGQSEPATQAQATEQQANAAEPGVWPLATHHSPLPE